MKNLYTIVLALFVSLPLLAQTGQLKGRVFDAYNSNPLIKANIQVAGVDMTTTDENGVFFLTCNDSMQITVFSIGYEPYKQVIKNCSNELNIGLNPSYDNLNEVEVTGSKPESHMNLKQAQSIGILTTKELNRNDGLFLENSLNLLSGVRMEKRTLNGGQRITIRGYGNSSNFNGSGIKTYLNGIPVTDAEGTTILDDVDFSTLGKVEVIKGPASSLYGTGIGGVVKMYTARPTYKGTKLTQQGQIGTFGLWSTNSRLQHATDKSSVQVNYGHQNYDGYRVHTSSKKDFVSFISDFRNNDKQTISVYAGYSYSYNQLAGQLDSASFFNKENKGEEAYLNNNAHVEFETYRTGVSHSYEFSKHFQNVTSVYVSGYKQSQASAAGLNNNLFQNYGSRTEFNINLLNGKAISIQGTIGGEFIKSNSYKKTYSLSDTTVHTVPLGTPTKLTADLQTASMQYSIFTQWDIKLPHHFVFTVGGSYNFIEYQVADRLTFPSTPAHKDQSVNKIYTPIFTPRIALQKSITENISVYGNVSQGYSPPTPAQSVIVNLGQVNSDLKPEKGTMIEIGSKGNLLNRRLTYQVALFSMQITDKLTTQNGTLPVPYSFTTNTGKQLHQGLEIDLAYTLHNDTSGIISLIRPFGSFTYSDFKYKDYKNNNNNDATTIDYTGKKVSGVAPIMFNVGLDVELKWGIYLYTTYQYVDEMPITYDNSHSASAYSLLNAKLGYRKELGKHFAFDIYAGGNNLTNSLYYNMVFLNQPFPTPASPTTPAPALYLPAAYTATFYGGLNLSYKF
ncbi:MAG: TonB-dependent receptor [Chitinophagaceae bacterium]|nr:TonB-dependent receptor [Chitinophagaceae bacterium]